MAWTDDQIDELYRKASQQIQPTLKEEYWAEMEALLDSPKKKRHRIPVWMIGAVGMIGAIIVALYYFDTPKKEHTPKYEQTQSSLQKTTEKRTTNEINDNKELVANAPLNQTESSLPIRENRPESPNMLDEQTQENTAHVNNISQIEQDNHSLMEIASNTYNIYDKNDRFVYDVSPLNKRPVHQLPLIARGIASHNQVKEPLFKDRLSYYSGINFALSDSYKAKSTTISSQWGLQLGVNYAYNDHLRLGFGLGFRREKMYMGASPYDLTIHEVQVRYSLGEIRQERMISYNRIQFIDLNIHAHYLLGPLRLGIQLSPSYTLGVRGWYRQIVEMSQEDMKSGQYQAPRYQEEQLPYAQSPHISSFGINMGLSFQYEFDNNMILELGLHSRLNKMLVSQQFEGMNRTLPLRIEIGVVKHFVK